MQSMRGSLRAAIQGLERAKVEAAERTKAAIEEDRALRSKGGGPPKAPAQWGVDDLRIDTRRSKLRAARAERWKRGCDRCWTHRDGRADTLCPDCGQLSRLAENLTAAALPSKLWPMRFDWSQVAVAGGSPVLGYIERWGRDLLEGRPGGSTCLVGPPGRGKSALAFTLAKSLLLGGHRAKWVSWPKHLEQIRESFNTTRSSTVWEWLPRHGLLVVDDLGASRPSEWVREQAWGLLEDQPSAVTLLITTNCSPGEGPGSLEGNLGERAASRIYGACGERVFTLLGEDKRKC